MRNTFEKGGFTGGESMNIKSGNVGIFAYNLIVGSATNGPKASNNGGVNPQTNVQFYNNTIIASVIVVLQLVEVVQSTLKKVREVYILIT